MNKLDVGMYARTDEGIKEIIGYDYDDEIENGHHIHFKNDKYGLMFTEEELPKCSLELIDLIEVGDYVNGYKVYYCYCADEDSTGLFIDTEKGRQWLDKPSQIKSIVTKEQFSSMEYRLGE